MARMKNRTRRRQPPRPQLSKKERRADDQGLNDAHKAEYQRRLAEHRKQRAQRPKTPTAGPVTITRADGTVTVEPPLTPAQLRRVAPERPSVDALRSRVLERDGGACRYCGKPDGPFEIDHVIPVALGGVTAMSNLVTACWACNRVKGATVWKPRPLTLPSISQAGKLP